jgi:hypothetical protein
MVGFIKDNLIPGILVGAFMLLIVEVFGIKEAQAVTNMKVDTIIISIDRRLGRIEEFIDGGKHE